MHFCASLRGGAILPHMGPGCFALSAPDTQIKMIKTLKDVLRGAQDAHALELDRHSELHLSPLKRVQLEKRDTKLGHVVVRGPFCVDPCTACTRRLEALSSSWWSTFSSELRAVSGLGSRTFRTGLAS